MNKANPDPITRRGTAYHIAGHAVAQYFFGMTTVKVSILNQAGGISGETSYHEPHQITLQAMGVHYEDSPERARFFSNKIMMSWAGEVAQREHCPESVTPINSERDQATIKGLIHFWSKFATTSEKDERIKELREETVILLNRPECVAALHAVAQALLDRKELAGAEAMKIISQAGVQRASPVAFL